MPSLNHVHKYVRYNKRGGKKLKDRLFRCADPGCSHYTQAELVIDHYSRCTVCDGRFILDREAARRAEPRCPICTVHKGGSPTDITPTQVRRAMDAIRAFLEVEPNDRNKFVVGLSMSLYSRMEDWLAKATLSDTERP